MRVLVVLPWEPWRTGDGVVLPVFHHLHELAQRHEITVLAGSGSGTEVQVVGPERGLPEGVRVRWFGTNLSAPVDLACRRARALARREPDHALYVERKGLLAAFDEQTRSADLVYLAGWGTAQLARRTALPAVHFAVDPWAVTWSNRRQPLARRLFDTGQAALVRRHEATHYPASSHVVVVAEADADLLRAQVPGARFAVVPNGVEPGPEPALWPSSPVLGLHGSFETQANVDAARALVEQLWPRVRALVPQATVLLAGRGPGPEVTALVQQGVELAADVPSMRPVLDRTSVHVSWMTSGLGMKNKVLEALAAGRPVVANSLGANGIGAGPGLQVTDDPEQAAVIIAGLLDGSGRQQGIDGRARVLREHSWTASAAALESVWQEAVR